ncbi:MAG: MFS transporter [Bacillota bacterium]|nr:MFS transporter [Bacillota bacterium]MDW7729805.1 MFS transporter [Bacillota bacterium]
MKEKPGMSKAGNVVRELSSEEKSFSYAKIWWIGFGFLGVQLVFTTYNAFLPLMYREFFESRAIIGLLMGTDNLIGLLLIPIIGAWSDRVNTPLGRRLPFMVVAVPVAALTFFAIPFASVVLWTLIITEILFTAAMHSYRGPVITLMPDHTPPEKRSAANGIINLMGGLGTLIAFGGLSLLYDIDPRLTFGIGAFVLILTLFIVWKKADRHPPYVDNTLVASRNPIREAIDGIKVLLKPENFGQFLILAAMLTYFIGFAGLDAMFPIYGVETLGLTEGRAAFILTTFAGSFLVFALLAGLIGTRIGKIPAMLIGLAIVPAMFLLAIPVRNPNVIAVIFVFAGFAWALVNVQAMPLIADLGGRDRIGFYIGLYYVFTMTGQMIGPSVLGLSMDLMGNHGMFVAGAAVYALGFLLLRAGQKRLGRDPEEIAREVKEEAV